MATPSPTRTLIDPEYRLHPDDFERIRVRLVGVKGDIAMLLCADRIRVAIETFPKALPGEDEEQRRVFLVSGIHRILDHYDEQGKIRFGGVTK